MPRLLCVQCMCSPIHAHLTPGSQRRHLRRLLAVAMVAGTLLSTSRRSRGLCRSWCRPVQLRQTTTSAPAKMPHRYGVGRGRRPTKARMGSSSKRPCRPPRNRWTLPPPAALDWAFRRTSNGQRSSAAWILPCVELHVFALCVLSTVASDLAVCLPSPLGAWRSAWGGCKPTPSNLKSVWLKVKAQMER
jgi:hypothetical protein